MKTLTLLHRWAGGIVGLLLAVIALSGTALVWEESWIGLPGADDPLVSDTKVVAGAIAKADTLGDWSRITFASEDFGLHLAIFADGSGAYIDQKGQVVDRWFEPLGRPELWLFDLHHYLLAGETGENVAGVLGLLLVFFSVSGAILWWRTRKTFRFRLLPQRMTRSAIVRHHRDLGVVAAPLLLLSGLTGSLMVFPPFARVLLSPWGDSTTAPQEFTSLAPAPGDPQWDALVASATTAFPGAAPRRLQRPPAPGQPYLMRMRQDFEWTPNGRSYVYIDPASAKVVGAVDPGKGTTAQAIQEKFYPVHAGKTGGFFWKLLLTLGGVSLALLGTFAVWSFWLAPAAPVRTRPRIPASVEAGGNAR